MTRTIAAILILLCVWVTGCSHSFETIRDIRELPQDHRSYLRADVAREDILPAGDQAALQERYNSAFFLPWHQDTSPYGREDTQAFFRKYVKKVEAADGKKRGKRTFVRRLLTNARLTGYPNTGVRAITIRPADMRGLPTERSFRSPGGRSSRPALSFDRLQVSFIPANTPVFISHLSRDRKWCLAETGYAIGWMMMRDLAVVDAAFVAKWEQGSYIAFVKDGTPIHDGRRHRFKATIGSLFPRLGEEGDVWEILVAVRGNRGRAVARHARVPKSQAVRSPLSLNLPHIAAVANEFVGYPYGWGGKGGKRDCSSMIRDLFAPFGIWLPRHSTDQALEGGCYVDLAGQGRQEKQAAIMDRGVPYLTLLWVKGHIMLYVGTIEDEPLVFHSFWSVKTADAAGRVGRKVIGRAAITTLHPGREFQGTEPVTGDLLDALQGMTILVRPAWSTVRQTHGKLQADLKP